MLWGLQWLLDLSQCPVSLKHCGTCQSSSFTEEPVSFFKPDYSHVDNGLKYLELLYIYNFHRNIHSSAPTFLSELDSATFVPMVTDLLAALLAFYLPAQQSLFTKPCLEAKLNGKKEADLSLLLLPLSTEVVRVISSVHMECHSPENSFSGKSWGVLACR